MSYSSKVTSKGTVTINAPLREKYGIEPGQEVTFEETEDGLKLQIPGGIADLRQLGQHNRKNLPDNLRGLSWPEIRKRTAEKRHKSNEQR